MQPFESHIWTSLLPIMHGHAILCTLLCISNCLRHLCSARNSGFPGYNDSVLFFCRLGVLTIPGSLVPASRPFGVGLSRTPCFETWQPACENSYEIRQNCPFLSFQNNKTRILVPNSVSWCALSYVIGSLSLPICSPLGIVVSAKRYETLCPMAPGKVGNHRLHSTERSFCT
jgi:hypothetical protein